MGTVFDKRDKAVEHTPTKGQTLGDIVESEAKKHAPTITWQELAKFNWGTSEKAEVNRALIEQLGADAVDDDDPSKTTLDPALGPSGDKKLLLPKALRLEDLDLEKIHKLKVKKTQPAPAVSIEKLSRWFIPDTETCKLNYRLEGVDERASKVDLVVYASNYCKATWKDESGVNAYEFTPLDIPIHERLALLDAGARASHDVADWKGESTATDGVLKPRDVDARFINVASSPYSVMIRYYKDDTDRNVAITLDPFWPRFDPSDKVVKESLKIQWKLKNGDKLEHGTLLVVDKADKVVHRRGLDKADLAKGEWEWAEGDGVAKPDQMPYRAQIQAHSGILEANGVAVAVMHTEVRLAAHPDLGKDPDPLKNPEALEIGLAPFLRSPKAPAKGTTEWYKQTLAAAGFHPGPIDGDATKDEYKLALAEFQRSYPKETVAPFTRLEAKGAEDGDTEAALDRLAADARPFFGDPASRADHDHNTAEGLLKDKSKDLIVWVDDRHGFTDEPGILLAYIGGASHPVGADRMLMESYRGELDAGDTKVTKDAASSARPWIPVQVGIPLLSEADELDSTVVPVVTDAMRRAIGPLRVDWTFTETGEDLGVIDAGAYTHERARTRRYVHEAVEGQKAAHKGKDLTNCPEALGGIRPATAADYFKAAFPPPDKCLRPWQALPDATLESVCTYVHDDLGQDEAELLPSAVGRAGIYLNPSLIAGDGYRFRAELSFAKHPGGKDHPNRAALEERYPRHPQGHTATLRVWRKTSFRGYVRWSPAGTEHWQANGAWENRVADLYRAAHVHFVHEGGAPNTFTLANLITADEYKDIITARCNGADFTDRALVTRDLDYVWPWCGERHMGIKSYPPPGDDIEGPFMKGVWNDTWNRFRIPLVHHLLHAVEKEHGLLRGHLIAEMQASPRLWTQTYRCNVCNVDQTLLETTGAGGSASGQPCHDITCGGHLATTYQQLYGCYTCTNSHVVKVEVAGNPNIGAPCPHPCTGTLQETVLSGIGGFFSGLTKGTTHNVSYECSQCGTKRNNVEPKVGGPLLAGVPCAQLCRGTLAQSTPPTKRENIADIRYASRTIGISAVGTSLSATWVFCDGANAETWAHEIGHHRQLEHAASAPSFQITQHDTEVNDLPAISGEHADDRRWDRCCIMGYTKIAGDDKLYFCGKCVLKNRGWKVEGLANPAKGDQGP